MKKITSYLVIAATCIAVFFTGCRTIPSESTIYSASKSIGVAAGYAVEISKTKTSVKTAITDVLDIAVTVTPATNETFVAAWTPVIDTEVAKLLEAGKLDEQDAKLVKNIAYVACEGVDLIFVRYPVAKQYQNIVSSAVDGFYTGFKSVISTTFAASGDQGYDHEAYIYLRTKITVM